MQLPTYLAFKRGPYRADGWDCLADKSIHQQTRSEFNPQGHTVEKRKPTPINCPLTPHPCACPHAHTILFLLKETFLIPIVIRLTYIKLVRAKAEGWILVHDQPFRYGEFRTVRGYTGSHTETKTEQNLQCLQYACFLILVLPLSFIELTLISQNENHVLLC